MNLPLTMMVSYGTLRLGKMDIKNGMDIKRRSPKKFKAHYTLTDVYQYYLRIVDPELHVDYKTFRKLNKQIYNEINQEVLYNSENVQLPYGVGQLVVLKRPMRFGSDRIIPLDYKKTKELGKRVFHMNEIRNNQIYKYSWVKVGRVINKGYYTFKAIRERTRELSGILQTKPEIEYFDRFNIY